MDFKGHLPHSTEFPVGKLRPGGWGRHFPRSHRRESWSPPGGNARVPLTDLGGPALFRPHKPSDWPGAGTERAAVSSGEPLRQARRKTASSVSTPEPAVTHRALTFRVEWEGTRRPCSHLPHCPTACRTLSAAPQLRVVQLLGWGAHPSPAASPGPSGEALMSLHCTLPGQP